ncbi:hypothetical protein [Streptomyces brevispora]|uniref:Neocarzinostatin family protein n=1 Tax=Streptomyces brevispora TaxID=887462 RepID=A0ABZ1G911_9ACTN|nr:hypothetical protein [Streptomyces brevispora]WSC15614.1 hypothetical protein OIE64_24130 [Streptomyces brevispora]
MRSIPLTFCAAAVVAATLTPASVALASSGSDHQRVSPSRATLSVSPSSVGPGGKVDLKVDGCKGKEARGNSDAFVSEARFSPGDGDALFAGARIRSDAEARDYEVQVVCKGDKDGKDGKGTRASAVVTVVQRDGPAPVAPVSAGGGGTAVLAGHAAHQEGPGTVHAVIGLVLVAVSVVAVVFRGMRRRRPAGD